MWNTFDGSDVVDGGPGTDTLLFQSGSSDGTADGPGDDTIAIVQNGAGFALYRDRGNVSMNVQNAEVLQLNTFGGIDAVATTGLVSTTQFLQTMFDGLPDTLTFDPSGLCPLTVPGGIEVSGVTDLCYSQPPRNCASERVIRGPGDVSTPRSRQDRADGGGSAPPDR